MLNFVMISSILKNFDKLKQKKVTYRTSSSSSVYLSQGSQTRGPWAACCPPIVFLQPALLQKFKKYLIFQLKSEVFIVFDNNCGPQSHFILNLQPAEQFFLWLLSAFELETFDLSDFSKPIRKLTGMMLGEIRWQSKKV